MTADDLRIVLVSVSLILASRWVGSLIGELHAAYQIRKHERES